MKFSLAATFISSVGLATNLVAAADLVPPRAKCNQFIHKISASATNVNLTDGSALPVSGTWNLGFSYCEPVSGAVKSSLQILVHGITYDRKYWGNETSLLAPSYVDFAAANGYATLSYDRLGSGVSDKPDPVNVVQTALQVAIAAEIITLARSGVLVPRKFSKIIQAGHSYGSILTNGVMVSAPGLLDAGILTGYTHRELPLSAIAIGGIEPAVEADPVRFAGLDPNYLTTANITSRRNLFYGPDGSFLVPVLEDDEATKGTEALGEGDTALPPSGPAAFFAGAVITIVGDADILFCDTGCSNVAAEQAFYPNASFTFSIIPFTGHDLNLHLSAPATYARMQAFLSANRF